MGGLPCHRYGAAAAGLDCSGKQQPQVPGFDYVLCSLHKKLTVLLPWLPTGPSGARCKIVREEQTEVQREVAAAVAATGNKTGAKPHVQREVHVQQTLETVGINVSSQQPEWSACYWKNACLQVSSVLVPTGSGHPRFV